MNTFTAAAPTVPPKVKGVTDTDGFVLDKVMEVCVIAEIQ
jgi:hypothetical protein